MNDPEFKKLVKKFFLTAFIILIFIIPVFIIFYNRYKYTEDTILNNIRDKKTFILYITENKCSNCKEIEKALKNTKYRKISKNNNDYNLITSELGIYNQNITAPALMIIKKGVLDSYIVDIKDKKEVKNFITQNKR